MNTCSVTGRLRSWMRAWPQSIWLCWPGAVSNRTVARSAACSAVRNGRTNRFTVS